MSQIDLASNSVPQARGVFNATSHFQWLDVDQCAIEGRRWLLERADISTALNSVAHDIGVHRFLSICSGFS
jgi:hypothetical protein